MARLREPEAATTGDAVPEHLAVCWVEDWVDPETEPVPDHVLSELSCGVGDLRFGWASLARRRWLVARERWCQERGMTKRDLMARHHGHMRPRWRSPSSSSSGTPPGGPLARARPGTAGGASSRADETPHSTTPQPWGWRGTLQRLISGDRRGGERSRAQHHR